MTISGAHCYASVEQLKQQLNAQILYAHLQKIEHQKNDEMYHFGPKPWESDTEFYERRLQHPSSFSVHDIARSVLDPHTDAITKETQLKALENFVAYNPQLRSEYARIKKLHLGI